MCSFKKAMAQMESAVSDVDWVDVASEHAELAGGMSSSNEEDLLLLFENQRWCVSLAPWPCACECATDADLQLHDLFCCLHVFALFSPSLCGLCEYNKQVRGHWMGCSYCYRPLSVEQWPRLSRLGHVVCAVRVSWAKRVCVCVCWTVHLASWQGRPWRSWLSLW